MEQTEYVYCVLDTGELHLPIGSDSYWPLQASTMRLCHKQGSLHATLIITLSMHKILENTRVHKGSFLYGSTAVLAPGVPPVHKTLTLT